MATTTAKPKTSYVVCAACGKRHSTLTRHKCFDAPKQAKKKKLDPKDLDDKPEGGAEGGGDGDGGSDKETDGDKDPGKGKGEGSSEGEGKGEGEGEEEGDGDGNGEGEGEGEGEGPAPQLPPPDMPVEQVICTVLKFAALTANCAKNGVVEITLTEAGLMIYGHNGDNVATHTMTWGEFEKRSTIDGEFYVKSAIDWVDESLIGKALPYTPPEPPKPVLTLPLTLGQRVVNRLGDVGTVEKRDDGACRADRKREAQLRVQFDSGAYYWVWESDGRYCGCEDDPDFDSHIVSDAPGWKPEAKAKAEAKLTLPLTAGQKVVRRDGYVTEAHGPNNTHFLVAASGNEDDVGIYTAPKGGASCWAYDDQRGRFLGQNHRPAYAKHIWRDALPSEKVGQYVAAHPEGSDENEG